MEKLRRSSKACHKCHGRKVRCDVTRTGPPCSNCRTANIDCVQMQSKQRGRKRKINPEYTVSPKPPDNPPLSPLEQQFNPTDCIAPSADRCEITNVPQPWIGVPLSPSSSGSTVPSPGFLVSLPPNVCPVPQSWTHEEIRYLSAKGALTLPSPEFRNALLQSYVEWVHPLCPLLDLRAFLCALAQPNGESGSVSLLVFHAVMLAGAAFIDDRRIKEAGYSSRFSARKDFFTRAKLLYSLGYEKDRLRIVQALLLMSYWQEIHDEPTNHWYWVELGCVVARTIGLYREPGAENLCMGEDTRRLWKRVGWSCMLRDRVINLGVRMPSKISEREFHLSLLSEDDFDIGPYPEDVTKMLGQCELLTDPGIQARLARMCIAKCQLCILLGTIFAQLYDEASPKLGTTSEVTLILLPKTNGCSTSDVSKIEEHLQAWLSDLPDDMQHQEPREPFLGSTDELALIHRSLVLMFYRAIMCAFYRPQLLASGSATLPGGELTQQKMNYATLMITRHLEFLHAYGLLRFLPPSAVTFLLVAAVNHLVEYKNVKDEDGKQRHLNRFRDCQCYLKPLQAVHVYAKYAGIFLTGISHRAGVMATTTGALVADGTLSSTNGLPGTDELGPWAIAHTPKQLLNHQGATADDTLTRRSHNHAAMATWGQQDFSDSLSVGMDSFGLDTVDELVNTTVWGHGWLDEFAEKWPGSTAAGQDFGTW